MSFLSDLKTYWAANSTLNAAIPASGVYLEYAPETATLPYTVITVIASLPTFTTEKGYFEEFAFQVAIYHTSAASAESLGQTLMNALDWQAISAQTISCMRTNYFLDTDPENPQKVYRALIEYTLNQNRSLP